MQKSLWSGRSIHLTPDFRCLFFCSLYHVFARLFILVISTAITNPSTAIPVPSAFETHSPRTTEYTSPSTKENNVLPTSRPELARLAGRFL